MLSICDIVFRTSLYGEPLRATGVGDPVVDADNGRGLIAMQWWTLKRFWGAFRRRLGWTLGEGAVSAGFAPIPIYHLDLHAMIASAAAPGTQTNPAECPPQHPIETPLPIKTHQAIPEFIHDNDERRVPG